jgi:PTH1 family peptidyl-tRNA hydrolase
MGCGRVKLLSRWRDWMMDKDKRLDSLEQEIKDVERLLIVGLGNPGRKYRNNRHNIGYMAVERLAADFSISLERVQQRALVGSGWFNGHLIFLAKPQTFMNNSGDSVGPLARYYKIPAEHILVVYDELDLPQGSLRLRPKGGSGGHKGMKSVIQHIGNDFPRLRLGIGRPPGRMDPAAYVLQDFRKEELPLLNEQLSESVTVIEHLILYGLDEAMNRHN